MVQEKFRPGSVVMDKETRRSFQAMAEDYDVSVARLYGRAAELAEKDVQAELEAGELPEPE